MSSSIIPDPNRLRSRPSKPFSWVDPSLIRNGHHRHCQSASLALYLVLVAVGNRHGISYYKDSSLCGMLKIDPFQLRQARRELVEAQLIAYHKPNYQVLDLQAQATVSPEPSSSHQKKALKQEPLPHISECDDATQQAAVAQLQAFRERLRRNLQ